jgi:hypothetical protein
VDNPLSRAAGSKHRPIDRIYTAASLAKQQERAVATSFVHSAAAAKPYKTTGSTQAAKP